MLQAFIVMPFDDSLDGVFSQVREVLQEHGFDVSRADTTLNQQNVLRHVVVSLAESDLVIADLTGLNPNVMYETGLAHALDRPVLLIAQHLEELPFDLRSYRVLTYSPIVGAFEKFRDELARRLSHLDRMTFGSPVSDHLSRPLPTIKPATDLVVPGDGTSAVADSTGTDEAPLGYLDHLERIQNAYPAVTEAFRDTRVATDDVGREVSRATEMLRAAQNGPRKGSVKDLRVAARVAADAIRRFSDRVAEQRSIAAEQWAHVDESLPYILDWQTRSLRQLDTQQRTQLRALLGSVESQAAVAADVRDSIRRLRESLLRLHGFDRGLNGEIDTGAKELDAVAELLAEVVATAGRARDFRDRLDSKQ